LSIKEEEKRLTLNEHDDEDDTVGNELSHSLCSVKFSIPEGHVQITPSPSAQNGALAI
jgi:hypothetical protein